MEQVLIREALVDDVPQSLGARLRGKGDPCAACATDDPGNGFIKAVHPLTGQAEADRLPLETIAQLHANGRECQIVGATEGEKGKIAIAGCLHPRFHSLHNLLRRHVPSGAGQHAGLTEAAAPGTAPADFHHQPIMDGFHLGHQSRGVVGDGIRHPPHHPGWSVGGSGHNPSVAAALVQAGDIHPRHLGKIPQQC